MIKKCEWCGEEFETNNKGRCLCIWCECKEQDGMLNDREMED